jgi:demethylmenaquinone methyltransferase/2-methoxy-6-polyprenyl-1,4-benzoquinol methylase
MGRKTRTVNRAKVKLDNSILRSVYNDIPEAYDRANRFISFYMDVRWRAELIVRALHHSKKPRRVLDVGAGRGELSYVLGKISPGPREIVMLDYAENMLETALVEGERVLASFEALPFREKCFDLVMSSFALHAADDVEVVVKEMKRVSGGVVAVIAMGKPEDSLRRLYLSVYLRFVMPYLAALMGAKTEDFKYIYYIYRRLPTNSFFREVMSRHLELKVYEERALRLFYFLVGEPKGD